MGRVDPVFWALEEHGVHGWRSPDDAGHLAGWPDLESACKRHGASRPVSNDLCVFACQTHSHAKGQRRKENVDTGITTVLAGHSPFIKSPRRVFACKRYGASRPVSNDLCVFACQTHSHAKAQRKRGCRYNDGAMGRGSDQWRLPAPDVRCSCSARTMASTTAALPSLGRAC